MNEFLQTMLSFPTLVWSVIFAFCIVYWLLAVTGLVHHDHAHIEAGSGHVDGHIHADGHAHHDHAESAGLLARLRLDGVPIMVVVTLLSFWAWVATYFVQLLVLSRLPSGVGAGLGVLTLLGALIPALPLTMLLVQPARALFAKLNPPETRPVLGSVGTVTTPSVDELSGMASFADGGAGLLLQVRAQPSNRFKRGQRVVLLEYNAANNTYFVVAEDEFNA